MCDPVSALSVASMAFGALGAVQQSQATKASMEYQSAVAKNNATISEWQAKDALERGKTAEEQQRLRTRQLKGSQTAKLAANGIDISEGSALNILSDTDWMGEQDALTIRNNANREAWGNRVQADNQNSNSAMLKASADAQNPLLSGVSSIMSNPNLGTVAGKWYNMSGTKTGSSTNQSAGGSTSIWA